MAIEGPLRELGIHDVFQLLDLSRKTGVLTVTSAFRDNQGTVYFERGAVLNATVRSNPFLLGTMLVRAGKISTTDLANARVTQEQEGQTRKLGAILVSMGALSQRELERHIRFQIEEVVFELLSWQEGFFSFEEVEATQVPSEGIRISTESLLMEGARRIDEWSRIEPKVPSAAVIPVLAGVSGEHPTLLDLLPNEWEVLSEIDGTRSLREIASGLARSDFEVAKIVYGLLATEVIELRPNAETPSESEVSTDAAVFIERSLSAAKGGDWDSAIAAAKQAVSADQGSAQARLALACVLAESGRHREAAEELAHAVQLDALHPDVHGKAGYAAAWCGSYADAIGSWERYLRMYPAAPDAQSVRAAIAAASELNGLLRRHSFV